MGERRGSLAGAFVGGVLYTCGGIDENEHILSSVERFDPAVGAWGVVASMTVPRAGCAAVAVRGKLWVAGGKSGVNHRLNLLEEFDPSIGHWQPLLPMELKRVGASVVTLHGICYVFGGSDGEAAINHTECYDLAADAWTPGPSLSEPR